jgi:pyrroline-5-carboxylate reductase
VIEAVGIIGVGHLATYLVEGLHRANPDIDVLLSLYLGDFTEALVDRFGAAAVSDNQAVADGTDLVIVSTRPNDIVAACESVTFRAEQTVVSTAAGVTLERLEPVASPATIVRAMPITSAAICRSPTLLYPDHEVARGLFELLGSVHVLADEEQFAPASVSTAYYGWVYALLDEAVAWTIDAGVPPEIARQLILETTRGAAEMGLARPEQELSALLDSLATPGGITRDGLKILKDRQSLEAWTESMDVVLDRLRRVR